MVMEQEKNLGGRPTPYKESYNEQVFKLCLLGAKDKEIADFFDICEATLNNWKIQYPKFLESIKDGKDKADSEVAKSLYKRAIGYTTKEVTKEGFDDIMKVTKEVTKEVPPDTGAAMAWLKNRQPEKWRDKQEIDHTNKGGEFKETTRILFVKKTANDDE